MRPGFEISDETVDKFIRMLKEQEITEHTTFQDLGFYKGYSDEAINLIKRCCGTPLDMVWNIRMLMIYMHGDFEEKTQKCLENMGMPELIRFYESGGKKC